LALEHHELVPNQKVDVDGESGVILATDAQMSFLARENGKIDLYQTDYLSENGSVTATPEEPGSKSPSTPESESSTTRRRATAETT